MELPLGGPALRHYTQSRPRPHRQKLNYRPSRPQETIIESENEVLEHMGRVDEGVEEFFTKKVLPTDTLKKQDEEIIIQQEVAPASSAPCPPQPKTLRRKLGDFFTLRKRRGLKSETSHEGRPKKASIADLIRPLREVARAEKEKDKERVKEHDKENEKEKTKESPTAVTGELDVQETPVTGAAPLRGEAVPPRRALREGKSQSLILLSGSSSTAVAAAGTTNARNTAKKQFEGQHSFEQKLHLMLQRIGVSKAQPGEAQNPEREMKKAESEGTIIDSKPEPPPTFTKPRTMSASSDTRHQIRPSVSAHESAGKPALLPKPVIKPGPAPSTSGRNTPENELTQTQKGETDTPTKQSPPATPSSVSTTTTPTVLTISDSAPDSTSSPISPASTVTDSNICTDSGKPTTAATTSANVTELNSKSPAPDASITTTTTTATEVPNSTLTSTDPHAPASVESITPSQSITSTTTSPPSITTSETVSAPSAESSVSTASSNVSAKSTRSESNGTLSVTGPASVVGDAATSVTTTVGTASSVSTAVSDAPSHATTTTTTTASTTEARDDLTSAPAAPASCATLVSSVTTTTSRPQSCCDTITLSSDAPITSPPALDSIAPPPTGTTSASTTGPTSTDCMDILSPSSITHSATHPTDISVPSTSSSETKHTDTKTSLTATISPPLTTHSDPPSLKKANTTASSFPTTDSSSASSTHLTSPVASSPSQDTDLKTHRELSCSAVPTSKPTADDRLEMVQEGGQAEKNESKAIVKGIKESDTFKEKPAPINKSEVASKEVQEGSGKPEEATATKQAAEPASGKKGVSECHNQQENKSKEEK